MILQILDLLSGYLGIDDYGKLAVLAGICLFALYGGKQACTVMWARLTRRELSPIGASTLELLRRMTKADDLQVDFNGHVLTGLGRRRDMICHCDVISAGDVEILIPRDKVGEQNFEIVVGSAPVSEDCTPYDKRVLLAVCRQLLSDVRVNKISQADIAVTDPTPPKPKDTSSGVTSPKPPRKWARGCAYVNNDCGNY